MDLIVTATDRINNLSRWEIGILVIAAVSVGFLSSRVGLLGPLAVILWIPFIGAATIWILFDAREQGFNYPSVVALTVAILLLLIFPGIVALATYYYKTRKYNETKTSD